MSDPPSYDNHLLDRLNALKKSSIKFDPAKPAFTSSNPSTPEQDLSARLRSLRNAFSSPSSPSMTLSKMQSPKSQTTPKPENEFLHSFPSIPTSQPKDDDNDPLRNPHALDTDDKTLDELLAELGPEDQWTLDPDDPKDIQKLLDEVRTALPPNEVQVDIESRAPDQNKNEQTKNSNLLTRDLDMSVFSTDNDYDEEEGDIQDKPTHRPSREERMALESREAEDIIAKAMDEVSLEKDNPLDPEEASLSLPSTPTTLHDPAPQTSDTDFTSSITARMAALCTPSSSPSPSTSPFPSAPTTLPVLKSQTDSLGLPSPPTFKPIDNPIPTVQKRYMDDEVDSWCIICQDDATVKCVGCDGDLYCATCWKEGHMGLDVGREEKSHRWVKWRKPN